MRPLLASLRIANAPSVVSNVLLGFLLGGWYWGGLPLDGNDRFPPALLALSLIGLCLLFGGNLLNDWHDRRWDAIHRPERALPSGKFSPTSYLAAAVSLVLAALICAFLTGTAVFATTLFITACIILYTIYHKHRSWSVLPMAACRAGLYLLGFVHHLPEDLLTSGHLTWWSNPDHLRSAAFILTHAAGLFAYLCALSLNARYESLAHPPQGMLVLSRALLFLPLPALSAWWIPFYPLAGALALLPFLIWMLLALTRFHRPVPRFVSALLVGIPLVDLIAAIPIAFTLITPGETLTTHPLVLAALLVPTLAFASARLLQKIAPAT
ncbi:MAG: UbiA family prenyltransferase [Akkermansiaceae bacterium]|jgi:4-hydroxybenzoate polyprenyltransferase|nr:UbiA family prenyltransferase [Akkermansiaceae bacterium]